ncbi:hypothetical protein [Shouchella clausii]|jgi:hypothetical protein|uniref:hypothetical protein n=1 Tax=Shouchella clausii TaxID=79880 RepID=UPI000BA7913F|nr:hypothetical protein [Shouchella clausii]MBX0321141.1 hypothetical protein [Shouchella clausii]PAF07580.1 hypothetical protein CHH65_20310 [Shouchella clausii]
MKKKLFSMFTSVTLVAGMTATGTTQAASAQEAPITNEVQQDIEPLEVQELEPGINKVIVDEDNYFIFDERTDNITVETYEDGELVLITETSANSTEATFKDASGSVLNDEQLIQMSGADAANDEVGIMGNTEPHPALPAGPHVPLGTASTYVHDTSNAAQFAAIAGPGLVAAFASSGIVITVAVLGGAAASVWTSNLPNNGAWVEADIGTYDFEFGGPILRHYEQKFTTYSNQAMTNEVNSGTWYTWHEIAA